MAPRFIRVLVLLLVVGMVAAGCSKKKDSTESGGGTITIAGQTANDHGEKTVSGGSLDVELDDFYFNPTTIKGPAGTQVTLNLKNESGTKHNFTLADQNVNQDLDPHQDVTVTVTMPSSGSLQFHCEYHEKSGMIGQLVAS